MTQQVRDALPAGTTVERIGGATRYETSELIVRDAFGESGAEEIFVATGRDFPDALAAGPAGAYGGVPVLLIDGRKAVDSKTTQVLRDLSVEWVSLVGGEQAISRTAESSLDRVDGVASVDRYAGADRYDTAATINDVSFFYPDVALLANGTAFPDALAGGPLAAAFEAPLYLSTSTCLPLATADSIFNQQISGVLLLGGEVALSKSVATLEVCGPEGPLGPVTE